MMATESEYDGEPCVCGGSLVYGSCSGDTLCCCKYICKNIMLVKVLNSRVQTDHRLRNASRLKRDPTRPSLFSLYPPAAFITATLREMSYPQPVFFKRYSFLTPHLSAASISSYSISS